MNDETLFDPKGLIREAFAIEGIKAPECRSIFLDWALGVPTGRNMQAEVGLLLAYYVQINSEDHPMIETLKAAMQEPGTPRRRGGRSGRV